MGRSKDLLQCAYIDLDNVTQLQYAFSLDNWTTCYNACFSVLIIHGPSEDHYDSALCHLAPLMKVRVVAGTDLMYSPTDEKLGWIPSHLQRFLLVFLSNPSTNSLGFHIVSTATIVLAVIDDVRGYALNVPGSLDVLLS